MPFSGIPTLGYELGSLALPNAVNQDLVVATSGQIANCDRGEEQLQRERVILNSRRLMRLEEELLDDGVPPLTPEGLEEVAYARYAPVHELRQPLYGAIVATPPQVPLISPLQELGRREVGNLPLSFVRLLADGITSFLGRDHTGHALLIRPVEPTESLLSELVQRIGVTIIQRLGSGMVRIYHDYGIATWNGSRWMRKPYSSSYSEVLVTAIASLSETPDVEIANALLDLCVHTLSAANVGATIIWDRTCREAELGDDDHGPNDGRESSACISGPSPLGVGSPQSRSDTEHAVSGRSCVGS